MASGNILWVCEPLAGQAPSTDPAGLAWIAGNDNAQIPVLTFDPGATEEEMDWKCYMPAHYDGGGVTLHITWSGGAAVGTGNVIWSAQFKSVTIDTDDLDTKAFAAQNDSTADTTASASGETVDSTIAFTDGADMDSVAAGEPFFLRIARSRRTPRRTSDEILVRIEAPLKTSIAVSAPF